MWNLVLHLVVILGDTVQERADMRGDRAEAMG